MRGRLGVSAGLVGTAGLALAVLSGLTVGSACARAVPAERLRGTAVAAPSALALFVGRGEGSARCGQGPNCMSYFITFISYYRRLC